MTTVTEIAKFLRTDCGFMPNSGGDGVVLVRKGRILVRRSFHYYSNRDFHHFVDLFKREDSFVNKAVQARFGVRLVPGGDMDPDTGEHDCGRVLEISGREQYYEVTLMPAAA